MDNTFIKVFNSWINPIDRLPDNANNVLVWYEYFRYGDYNCMWQRYGIACYIKQYESWFGEDLNGTNTKVLYWQPLPKPPVNVENMTI